MGATLGPKYILNTYMDPLGNSTCITRCNHELPLGVGALGTGLCHGG